MVSDVDPRGQVCGNIWLFASERHAWSLPWFSESGVLLYVLWFLIVLLSVRMTRDLGVVVCVGAARLVSAMVF